MPAATVTEIDDATTTPATNYFTYGGSGVWTANTGVTGMTNGTNHGNNTAGATATVNFSGKALYMIMQPVNNSPAVISVTIDGVSINSNIQLSAKFGIREVIPVARNLSDGPHVAVLTSGGGNFIIDGAFIISGAKGTPTTGNLVMLGDSWSTGSGASGTYAAYTTLNQQYLASYYKRPITAFNKGVNGDSWAGTSGTQFGGLWRLPSDVFANTPEFLTILFGVNDLRQGASLLEWNRRIISALSFIEDALDTSLVKVALGTPQYILTSMRPLVPAVTQYGSLDVFEEAVYSTRQIAAMFSWVKVAGVYEALDGRGECMVPNSSADMGLHPNDFGHSVIANEFFRILVGVNG